jgi:hypothetical protein
MALKMIYDNFADQTCVKVHYEVGFFLNKKKISKKEVLSEYLILWKM